MIPVSVTGIITFQSSGSDSFLLLSGLILSIAAAVFSFLITYDETIKHYPSRKKPAIFSLRSAVVAFIFFLVITLVLMLIL